MNWSNIFGTMTMVFGIAMVILGLSAQVLKNFKEKRSGNPLTLAVLACAVYLSRAGYAITIDSFYILIPDTIGICLSAITIIQWFYYKKRI
ncbi:hypothetical protein HN858_02970 [Candidatus Falkowbacteria bacterium]|jgi:hypothetical protein|nr:hypothetical protein [Candidatus Falkowbacteria bacterium]MBT5503391.1 hypothetical protein [Candidatus Falkowbacteria bacterium]MBT6574046.1 hypothetical protein [Candidatus Falkowbacteria bacterium]MBT7348615.1 hypothetical protein [Candidatus Falkowbacteria bacterium]MBT7500406.1 hypothetical protein [Candidatus Falkowbacteria bacterium]